MSGDSQKLLELAERCEEATGPDREMDVAIAQAAWPQLTHYAPHCKGDEPIFWDDPFCKMPCPKFTASLDAARTLVPEGYDITITQASGPDRTDWYGRVKFRTLYGDGLLRKGNAMNGALALCAAALRARASIT